MTRTTGDLLPAVRGGLLGLLLGDAVGATGGTPTAHGTLRATCAGQLACCTVEGLIRAHVRDLQRGICHPPSVVWNAYRRWAAAQGISGTQQPGLPEPDGWLAQVSLLGQRRGDAPATVRALRERVMGTVDSPVGPSIGAHGLTRSLPAWVQGGTSTPGRLAAEVAALTHRDEAVDAAGLGAAIMAQLAGGRRLADVVGEAPRLWAVRTAGLGPAPLAPAVEAARSAPRQLSALRRLAPDATAMSALSGGVYVALSLPLPDQVREALSFAASAGDGGQVATVAGALLGTAHGVDALPVDWLSRLELAWVGDILARDLVAEFGLGPPGSGRSGAADRRWWDRYPGW